MASKGGLGMHLDLDLVPIREIEMTSYEIMLSESQERMLMILKPGSEEQARSIFKKWDLDFANIGEVTNTGRLILKKNGHVACDIPITPLVEDAPEYNRPYEIVKDLNIIDSQDINTDQTINDILFKMFKTPNIASKKWIWEQYDSSVMADTVICNGNSDAAVVRVHGTDTKDSLGKGISMTTDCTPRYVKADPIMGGMQAVCEAARNIASSGSKPLAITNNLNFGNPEKKDVMGQIVGAIKGISLAASFLKTPIVSGNVSLYNETNGVSILPTPVIGMVGMIDNIENTIGINAKNGYSLILLGQDHNVDDGWLGCSVYQEIICGDFNGAPPPIDLKNEKKIIDLLLTLTNFNLIASAHDISDGGLLPAICDMLFFNSLGIDINLPKTLTEKRAITNKLHGWCFGENQARVIVATKEPKKVLSIVMENSVDCFILGKTNNSGNLNLNNMTTISINDIKKVNETTLPSLMGYKE
jgi:phosphoribosylformylglycinamidine synthase II